MNPFVFSGVNIFFLISGHFGIKLTLRSVIKFILTLLTFKFVNITLLTSLGVGFSLGETMFETIFPLSRGYWFIAVYFLLMLSSPMLNTMLKAMPQKELGRSLLILGLALSYMYGSHAFLNYFNGAFMYCVGYYLRHSDISSHFKKTQLASIFTLSCLAWGCANVLYTKAGYLGFHDYDNIFAFVSSISIYLLFSKMSFYSAAVNRIAACALGCYLLQDGLFGFRFFYSWQKGFADTHSMSAIAGMLALCFIGFWIGSFILTQINRLWLPYLTDTICNKVKYLKESKYRAIMSKL